MKVYKVSVLVIDHNEIGEKGIKSVLEHTMYPNHCIHPNVMGIESRDIGEWSDDHPLNLSQIKKDEFNHLFGCSDKIKYECHHCKSECYDNVEDIIHISFTSKKFCSKNCLDGYLNSQKKKVDKLFKMKEDYIKSKKGD
jgi:hypothetical protein